MDAALSPYKYCKGWEDYKGMGIAVIVAYDFGQGLYHVFMQDNLDEFQRLVNNREHVIGYNSREFDDKLCNAHGVKISTTFDLYEEVKIACGHTARARVKGYRLGDVSEANLGVSKTMNGADAPEMWQDRKYGAVISYCMKDTQLTVALFNMGTLVDPVSGKTVKLRTLFEAKNGSSQGRLDI